MTNTPATRANRTWLLIAGIVAIALIAATAAIGWGKFGMMKNLLNGNAASANKKSAKSSRKATRPSWAELSAAQKDALAPLVDEWDQINPARKKKWLEIGNNMIAMKPDEKQRVQERIRQWVKLTPEQRRVARSNYARAKQIKPDEKFAQWQRYQQLTEEQKKELAALSKPARKQVANPPLPTVKNTRIAKSVKSAPRTELEKSLQAPIVPPVAPATPLQPQTPVAPPVQAEAAPA